MRGPKMGGAETCRTGQHASELSGPERYRLARAEIAQRVQAALAVVGLIIDPRRVAVLR